MNTNMKGFRLFFVFFKNVLWMPVALALKGLKESQYRTVIVALFFCFGQAAGQYYVRKLLFFPRYSSFPNIIQGHLGPLVYNGLYAHSIGELNTCIYT